MSLAKFFEGVTDFTREAILAHSGGPNSGETLNEDRTRLWSRWDHVHSIEYARRVDSVVGVSAFTNAEGSLPGGGMRW